MEDYRKLLAKTAVAELKDQLRASKIRGFSKMKKADIVDLLVSKKQYSQPTTPAHEAFVAEKMAEVAPAKVVKEKVVKEKAPPKEKVVKEKAPPKEKVAKAPKVAKPEA